MSFPDFLPQSADAINYLEIGSDCAKGLNGCYDPLRPMGSVLWFSIPYRLGLPPEYIIIGNLLLVLISIILSGFAMQRLVQTLNPHRPKSKILFLILTGFSAAAHLLFLYPVMFNSLADTPAAVFALIAVWTLLLSRSNSSLAILGGSGAMLGLAAFFRIFYLMPVLIVLAAFGLIWRRQRRMGQLVFLVALLPILFQCMATYRNYGYFNYLQNKNMGYSSTHLKGELIGYDTLLPAQGAADGHPWKLEGIESGLFSLLWKGNIKDALRLLAGKIEFYLGTYSPRTYLSPPSQGASPANMRIWSKTLLLLNLGAIICAIWLFPRLLKVIGPEMHLVSTIAVTIIGEALLIIPEQRFIIAFQVLMWIAATVALFSFFQSRRSRKEAVTADK